MAVRHTKKKKKRSQMGICAVHVAYCFLVRNSRFTNCDARINDKNQPGRKSIRIYCLIKYTG